jgi:predicted MFS family arabinose efflux permease
VFGLISLASQVSSGLGPIGVGWLHDETGGYATPFTVTAVLTYVAAAVVLLARPVRERREAAARASAAPPVGTPGG